MKKKIKKMISQAKNLGLAQARGTPTRTGLKKKKNYLGLHLTRLSHHFPNLKFTKTNNKAKKKKNTSFAII